MGFIKPQNMVEHLRQNPPVSNGKKEIAQRTTVEEGMKQSRLYLHRC